MANVCSGPEVALMVDTFNTYFEPENARAAVRVLEAAGYRVQLPRSTNGSRPLCCGRTFLAAGLVKEAKKEAQRTLVCLGPLVLRGIPIIGLEPSCLLTLRDEFMVLGLDGVVTELSENALLFEEFLAAEIEAGHCKLDLEALPQKRALIHGHCHQKAFNAMGSVEKVLGLVPDLDVEVIDSSCCGMAGAFGYEAENYEISMRIGELNLLPAIRDEDADSLIIADGTSCRHQIADGAGRAAVHVARGLETSLKTQS